MENKHSNGCLWRSTLSGCCPTMLSFEFGAVSL
jgi:hypothetical protein